MKKLNIAVIAPMLAIKPKAKPAKVMKAARPAKRAAKGELNSDALEAPHTVKGKPHHFQYK